MKAKSAIPTPRRTAALGLRQIDLPQDRADGLVTKNGTGEGVCDIVQVSDDLTVTETSSPSDFSLLQVSWGSWGAHTPKHRQAGHYRRGSPPPHPEQGGSGYLAGLLDHAKDMLLAHLAPTGAAHFLRLSSCATEAEHLYVPFLTKGVLFFLGNSWREERARCRRLFLVRHAVPVAAASAVRHYWPHWIGVMAFAAISTTGRTSAASMTNGLKCAGWRTCTSISPTGIPGRNSSN